MFAVQLFSLIVYSVEMGRSVMFKFLDVKKLFSAFGLIIFLFYRPVLASPADKRTEITAAQFGAAPFVRSPIISSNGKRIAAMAVVKGKKTILIVDIDAGMKIQQIATSETNSVRWVKWAGDDRLLISIGIQTKLDGWPVYVTRLQMYDLNTKSFRPITAKNDGFNGSDVIHIDPAGQSILLAAQRSIFDWPAVIRVDLNTLAATQIVKSHTFVSDWYADPSGVVRAGIGSEGRNWWLLARASPDAPFEKIIRKRVKDSDKETDIERFVPVTGSSEGYAVANKSTGRFGLYRYDFQTDTIGDAVFEHGEVDIDDFDLSPSTGALRAVYYTDDRARVQWFDPKMIALQKRLDKALPGNITRVISTARDEKRLIIWSGGASDPGAYYLLDQSTKRMETLFEPYAELTGKTFSPVEAVSYTARDGLKIPAYLTKPLGHDPKNLPLVIMPHGGPFLRDSWEFNTWAQFLANRGYVVLQPNFRGSTGYGRDFVSKGEGQWGRKMQDDIDDGVGWLIKNGLVDGKRVCIMGASFGGYAAMWAAARNPEIYRCAISFAGISDVGGMMRYDRRTFSSPRYFRDWRDKVKGEEKYDLKLVSSLYAVDKIAIPILIAHGDKDDVVPIKQSELLRDALIKAEKPHEYVAYVGENHNLEKEENGADFLTRVDAFLKKHNPSQ